MSEGRLSDDPIGNLDISSLMSGGAADSFSNSPTPFEVRTGEEEVPVEPAAKEGEEDIVADKDIETPPVEDTSAYKGIKLREVEEDIEETLEPEEGEETPNMWQSLADAGLIKLEEGELDSDEEKDMEWFATKAEARIQDGIESAVEEYKESLPDEIKFLLDNHESGVSLRDLANAEKSIAKYADINVEALEGNEKMQKNLVKNLLELQGEDAEYIEEALQDLEDTGLLEKNSKRALSKLVNHEKREAATLIETQKQEAIARKEQYNTWLGEVKSDINEVEEIIPGLKLDDKQRKTLYEGITKLDKNGKNAVTRFREKDMKKFDMMVSYIATVLEGDFSSLTNVAETKAVQNLKAKTKSEGKSHRTPKPKFKGVDVDIMKQALKF